MLFETRQDGVHQIPDLMVLDRRQQRAFDRIDDGLVEGHFVLQVGLVELGSPLRLQQGHSLRTVRNAGIVVRRRGNQLELLREIAAHLLHGNMIGDHQRGQRANLRRRPVLRPEAAGNDIRRIGLIESGENRGVVEGGSGARSVARQKAHGNQTDGSRTNDCASGSISCQLRHEDVTHLMLDAALAHDL